MARAVLAHRVSLQCCGLATLRARRCRLPVDAPVPAPALSPIRTLALLVLRLFCEPLLILLRLLGASLRAARVALPLSNGLELVLRCVNLEVGPSRRIEARCEHLALSLQSTVLLSSEGPLTLAAPVCLFLDGSQDALVEGRSGLEVCANVPALLVTLRSLAVGATAGAAAVLPGVTFFASGIEATLEGVSGVGLSATDLHGRLAEARGHMRLNCAASGLDIRLRSALLRGEDASVLTAMPGVLVEARSLELSFSGVALEPVHLSMITAQIPPVSGPISACLGHVEVKLGDVEALASALAALRDECTGVAAVWGESADARGSSGRRTSVAEGRPTQALDVIEAYFSTAGPQCAGASSFEEVGLQSQSHSTRQTVALGDDDGSVLVDTEPWPDPEASSGSRRVARLPELLRELDVPNEAASILVLSVDALAMAVADSCGVLQLVARHLIGSLSGSRRLVAAVRELRVLECLVPTHAAAAAAAVVALRLEPCPGTATGAARIVAELRSYVTERGVSWRAATADAPAEGLHIDLAVGGARLLMRGRLLAYLGRAVKKAPAASTTAAVFVAALKVAAMRAVVSMDPEGAELGMGLGAGVRARLPLVALREVELALPALAVSCQTSPGEAVGALARLYVAAMESQAQGLAQALPSGLALSLHRPKARQRQQPESAPSNFVPLARAVREISLEATGAALEAASSGLLLLSGSGSTSALVAVCSTALAAATLGPGRALASAASAFVTQALAAVATRESHRLRALLSSAGRVDEDEEEGHGLVAARESREEWVPL